MIVTFGIYAIYRFHVTLNELYRDSGNQAVGQQGLQRETQPAVLSPPMTVGPPPPTPNHVALESPNGGVNDDPAPTTFRLARAILLQLRDRPKSAGRLLSSMRNGNAANPAARFLSDPAGTGASCAARATSPATQLGPDTIRK